MALRFVTTPWRCAASRIEPVRIVIVPSTFDAEDLGSTHGRGSSGHVGGAQACPTTCSGSTPRRHVDGFWLANANECGFDADGRLERETTCAEIVGLQRRRVLDGAVR